ncbi:MAG: hypothetical protein ACLFTK_08435 [Anaerolineales bacterium]
MAIDICKVSTPAEREAFFRFPWQHYKDSPYWVPELPAIRRETLSREHNPAWEYLEGDYFLARRGGQTVGTIAAFINHRHNEVHNEKMGFFGFFESIDDQAVAAALLNTAMEYVRGLGATALRGPANFTVNEQYGLLVEGFDQYPIVLMPYNPPYYMTLLENAGFEKAMDLYSWRHDNDTVFSKLYEEDGVTEQRTIKLIRRNNQRRKITVRTFDMRNKQRDFHILRELYDKGWEANWGHVPMTDRELDALVEGLGFLLLPRYTLFGEIDGEPAGFILIIPDFNQVLRHVRPHPGRPTWWWYLQAAWHWKIRPKITGSRAILFGVKREYHGLGVDPAMFLYLAEQLVQDGRFDWLDASWILENNHPTNDLAVRFGAYIHRRHRIYQKTL